MKLINGIFGGIAVLIIKLIIQTECAVPSTALEMIRQNLCVCPCGNLQGGKLYTVPTIHLNWFEAVAHCNSIGMSIATIKDANERRLLQIYLERSRHNLRTPKKSQLPYWIGANNLASGSGLRWGLSNQEVKSSEWKQAPASNNKSFCVYIQGETMKWVSAPCDTPHQFICEY
uniref:C-type lectin domain-containing protein n=1 Tax=Anopheles minimus TaxID=112268 RepID=A0A182WAK2_9DIPT